MASGSESGGANLDAFLAYVEQRQYVYKHRLAEAVAIPSVSGELDEHLPDIQRMMDWTVNHIDRLGGTHELRANPASTSARPLPPILMASFMADPKLKTVCVYGHLDVQPATKADGWNTDPFTLVEKDGKLYGRGSTDGKFCQFSAEYLLVELESRRDETKLFSSLLTLH